VKVQSCDACASGTLTCLLTLATHRTQATTGECLPQQRVSPAAAAFVRRWCLTLNRPLSLQCRLSSYQGCLPGSATNHKPLDIHGISVHLTAVVSHPSSPRPPRGMPQPHTPLQVSTALLIYQSPSGACGRYCVYIRGGGGLRMILIFCSPGLGYRGCRSRCAAASICACGTSAAQQCRLCCVQYPGYMTSRYLSRHQQSATRSQTLHTMRRRLPARVTECAGASRVDREGRLRRSRAGVARGIPHGKSKLRACNLLHQSHCFERHLRSAARVYLRYIVTPLRRSASGTRT
jgi:hypothetical protein